MVANRGFQSTGTKTRKKLIDAAWDLLAEEGYPAISARRVAGKAELKPQLVHYYFRSMEELIVTVFQRSAASYFKLHDEALSSTRPLHALWALHCSTIEARRSLEYNALAKQYPGLREEMRRSGEDFRKLQIEAVERIYAARKITQPQIGPAALVMLMSSVARNLHIENQVGLEVAHRELIELIEAYLACLEP